MSVAAWSIAVFILTFAPATIAIAADSSTPAVTDNRIAGAFSGLVLAVVVAYALFTAARELLRSHDRDFHLVRIALAVIWIAKTIAVAYCAGYSIDVGTYEAWALQIAGHGPASMYQSGFFLDYPPGYLYALWLAGAVANAVGVSSATALRIIVETPALAADFILAALIYVFVRRSGNRLAAWIAALFVALNPALLFDIVGWGQTDSALTLVLWLSVVMMIDEEFELGWALAALALLIKPQTVMILPVLGLWTLLKSDFSKWWRSALAFAAIAIVTVAPFQVAHHWNWLPDLYISTAAYYHETSVNAFNFMALLGGLRQADSGTILGVSYFWIGLTLQIPLYAFAGLTLWRNPTARGLLFASFITLLGFYMFAPRMHERYLYPAVVFAIPLAVEGSGMLMVFGLLTLTCLFNLVYVFHTLNTVIFLAPRDTLAMVTAAVNLIAFGAAAVFGYRYVTSRAEGDSSLAIESIWRRMSAGVREGWTTASHLPDETFAPFPWLRLDTALVLMLIAAAAILRFWHIGHPGEIVFDEVHFVGQARHYLRGEEFLDPHPPIAKLIIAFGILLFGDHSWSWRLGNATLGTLLVGVTYLLGRRMFRSRLAAALAAAFVACDGFFIVDSRIACIDIVYVTFAAVAYFLLFRFMQTSDLSERRRTLLATAVAVGLCLGSKLYVPGVTFLLVGGFVIFTLLRADTAAMQTSTPDSRHATAGNTRIAFGGIMLLGSVSAILYLGAFLPHYYLGWWGGIRDLFHYYFEVMGYEKSVSTATHPYASPWWSWPLMLRPVAYWQNFPQHGDVATIWGAGNPLTWWAVIPAMTITAVRALERPNITRIFLVIGFLSYYVIWIPIGRILFLYHYMPSVYIGYLALGGILADCWNGSAETWENLAILLTLAPALLVGLGHMAEELTPTFVPPAAWPFVGLPFAIAIGAVYISFLRHPLLENRFVFVTFLAAAAAVFIYFLPLWLGTPISRSGYYARMWLEGPGLRNWI